MFVGQCRQRLAVDFENQAVRFEIRIHPVERETFFDVKFAAGIFVEDDFGQQRVDFHHGHLPADLEVALWIQFYIFARLELMVLQSAVARPPCNPENIFANLRRWGCKFSPIHRPQVFEVSPVRQRVLGEREKWIGVHLRFLHRRDQEPSGIRAAKINASGRDGLNDVIAKIGGIFLIALTKCMQMHPMFPLPPATDFPANAHLRIWPGG